MQWLNPSSYLKIRWIVEDLTGIKNITVYDDDEPVFTDGEYGGVRAASVHTMTSLSRADNERLLSCLPLWNEAELNDLEVVQRIIVYCECLVGNL